MRYLRCRLTFAEDAIHPVHAALASDDAPSRDLLWQWSRADDADVFLYSVEGETEVYEAALAETPSVVEYELTASGDGRQYVYVRQESRAVDDDLLAAVSSSGVLVVPPVVFAEDGTAALTVVGESASLQRVVDEVPAVVDVAVERIGEYAGHPGRFDPGLTERQTEAVARAVQVGYFATPRTASVADVAADLDCSAATAAEHLRKAQTKVMRALVASW
ncbi:helix-turn-helix domain-containing protein [Halomarina salina]|uniref:Helix-turn-helix domain-containing protein n=1 Tax=Halomarina salina TaxID=1872699 RepID=A0ABD5RQX8_9EURY|nr:helix-turn-helix domain-containing protein [Halomarina salina]